MLSVDFFFGRNVMKCERHSVGLVRIRMRSAQTQRDGSRDQRMMGSSRSHRPAWNYVIFCNFPLALTSSWADKKRVDAFTRATQDDVRARWFANVSSWSNIMYRVLNAQRAYNLTLQPHRLSAFCLRKFVPILPLRAVIGPHGCGKWRINYLPRYQAPIQRGSSGP